MWIKTRNHFWRQAQTSFICSIETNPPRAFYFQNTYEITSPIPYILIRSSCVARLISIKAIFFLFWRKPYFHTLYTLFLPYFSPNLKFKGISTPSKESVKFGYSLKFLSRILHIFYNPVAADQFPEQTKPSLWPL
jgi:hypothetical protein